MFTKVKRMGGACLMACALLASGIPVNAESVTLQSIIDGTSDGGVVQLTQSYTENITITKNLTLDLNGYDITNSSSSAAIHVTNEVGDPTSITVTIMDSKGTGTIYQTSKSQALEINTTATSGETTSVVFDDCNIVAEGFGVSVFNDSTFTMNGGTITSKGNEYYAINTNGTTDPSKSDYGNNAHIIVNDGTVVGNDYAIYGASNGGSVTINGGTITGAAGAVGMNAGTLTINGGTLTSLGSDNDTSNSAVTSSSGLDWAENAVVAIPAKYTGVSVTIKGGTLVAEGNAAVVSDAITESDANTSYSTSAEANNLVSISGGSFSQTGTGSEYITGASNITVSGGTYAGSDEAVATVTSLLDTNAYVLDVNGAVVSKNSTTDNTTNTDNTAANTTSSESSSSSTDAFTAEAAYYESIISQIENAADGETITITKDSGLTALPNSIMQALYKKGTVNLKMEYTYEDQDYSITIPAGGAVNDDTAWYGPLYLSGNYSGAASATTQAATQTSSAVKSPKTGDVMPYVVLMTLVCMAGAGFAATKLAHKEQ